MLFSKHWSWVLISILFQTAQTWPFIGAFCRLVLFIIQETTKLLLLKEAEQFWSPNKR